MDYFERPLEKLVEFFKWPPLVSKLGYPHFILIFVNNCIWGVNEKKIGK